MHLLVVIGRHVCGTVTCCNWFPFTQSQVLKSKDNSTLIEEKGIRKLEKKKTSIDKRSQTSVIARAYRNGNDGVMLGIESSNVDSAFEYEIVFADDSDHRKWAKKCCVGLKKLLLSQALATRKNVHQNFC